MKKSIVVIGSSNTDMVVNIDHLPKPGETVIGGSFSMAAGGKGANQAVGAARAGGEVVFVARVGEDTFGEQAVNGFIEDNINVEYIIRDRKAPSGIALIFVDNKGENCIAVASSANANVSPADIKSAREVIVDSHILLMQLEIPLESVKVAAETASGSGVKVILNPAPAQPLGDDILKHISIITPNETEAELLTGIKVKNEQDAEEAAKTLLGRGIETIILTMGSQGVYVASSEFTGIVPAFNVDAVDTTAAGDVFNGVLAVAIAENRSLIDAVRFASAAAALSVMTLGAQTSAPHRDDIEKFLQEKR